MNRKIRRLLGEFEKKTSAVPRCTHFGECGGCSFQDMKYEEQLEMKRWIAEKIFDFKIEITPSEPFAYRNRMDFVCAFGMIGLRRKGTFSHVVEIENCPLMSRRMNNVFLRVKDIVRDSGLKDYNYLKHDGYLRYIVLREARFSNQIMINFVTATNDENIKTVMDKVSSLSESVIWSVNSSKSDVSFGEVKGSLKSQYIRERFDNISYLIGANTFFQTNPAMALKLYRRLKEEVYGDVLDLYCGVGGISLFIADKADKVIGVDIVKESIELAKRNTKTNRIDNVEFFNENVKDFLKKKLRVDIVVIDPPRAGLSKKIVERITRIRPEKIVYVSCNPFSLRRDIEWFKDYEIELIEAYDFFPQTPHFEMLGILKRK